MLAVRARKLFSVLSAILEVTADTNATHASKGKGKKMADLLDDDAKRVQYFPEGSLLNTLIISIVDSEKRFTDILKEPYTVYLIETK